MSEKYQGIMTALTVRDDIYNSFEQEVLDLYRHILSFSPVFDLSFKKLREFLIQDNSADAVRLLKSNFFCSFDKTSGLTPEKKANLQKLAFMLRTLSGARWWSGFLYSRVSVAFKQAYSMELHYKEWSEGLIARFNKVEGMRQKYISNRLFDKVVGNNREALQGVL